MGIVLLLLLVLLSVVTSPTAGLVLLMVCTLCGAWRPAELALCALAGLSVLALATVMFTPLIPHSVQVDTVQGAPHRTDAIIVLAGGTHCQDGSLNSSSLARTLKGLQLWRAGYAPDLVLSGGETHPAACSSVADAARRLVASLYPVGGPRISVLNDVVNTRAEARQMRALAEQRGWKTFLLVTSPTHTRRAGLTFRAAGLDVTTIAAEEPGYDQPPVLLGDRLTALRNVAREWAGMTTQGLRPGAE